jgi:hypothetical protein
LDYSLSPSDVMTDTPPQAFSPNFSPTSPEDRTSSQELRERMIIQTFENLNNNNNNEDNNNDNNDNNNN